ARGAGRDDLRAGRGRGKGIGAGSGPSTMPRSFGGRALAVFLVAIAAPAAAPPRGLFIAPAAPPLAPEQLQGGGGLKDQDQLLGDMGGLRSGLAKYGLSLYLGETSEVLDNLSGGIGRGPLYE